MILSRSCLRSLGDYPLNSSFINWSTCWLIRLYSTHLFFMLCSSGKISILFLPETWQLNIKCSPLNFATYVDSAFWSHHDLQTWRWAGCTFNSFEIQIMKMICISSGQHFVFSVVLVHVCSFGFYCKSICGLFSWKEINLNYRSIHMFRNLSRY